ncbi:MAG: hypothetical protein NTW87_29505 [Planctomycetota bacterium]|nr:hypothetical protein [Planctomycetota bacterium]
MGAESWERRRALLATVRKWLVVFAGVYPASTADTAYAAAWLHAAEVFRPEGMGEYTGALGERLRQSADPRGELIALGCDTTGTVAAAVTPASRTYLAVVAGPLWQCRDFPMREALVLLQADDRRARQAAAWRLVRPQLRPGQPGQADEAAVAAAVARELESAMQDARAPQLRCLALDALYRERRRKDPNGAIETWRLRWEADLALKAFLEDKDRSVQTSAAGILAKLGNSADIAALAQVDLAARAPEALERLFTALAQRWSALGGQAEYLTPGIADLCERVMSSGNDVAAGRAGWLRMHQPDLDAEAKVRLAGSFKSAAARAGAVRALGAGDAKGVLQSKLVVHLLSDPVAAVRAAVFEARLPRAVTAASDRATLYLKGLSDTDAAVRLAVTKTLELRGDERAGLVGARVRELAEKDPDPEVRSAAALLVRRWTEPDAGGTPQPEKRGPIGPAK